MKVFTAIFLAGAVVYCALNTQVRANITEYSRLVYNGASAAFGAAQNIATSDMQRCQSGDEQIRRDCLKDHEAPMDKLDSRIDTAGQQDALYKAMK